MHKINRERNKIFEFAAHENQQNRTGLERKKMSKIAISKPPAFEGKAGEAFTIWEMKFKAHAQEKGFLAMLLDSFDTKLPSS